MAKIAGIASAIDYDPSSQPANIHDEAMREIKRIAHEALGDEPDDDWFDSYCDACDEVWDVRYLRR